MKLRQLILAGLFLLLQPILAVGQTSIIINGSANTTEIDYEKITSIEVKLGEKFKAINGQGRLKITLTVSGVDNAGKEDYSYQYQKVIDGNESIKDFLKVNAGKKLVIWDGAGTERQLPLDYGFDRMKYYNDFKNSYCVYEKERQVYNKIKLMATVNFYERTGYEKYSSNAIEVMATSSAYVKLNIDKKNIVFSQLGIKIPRETIGDMKAEGSLKRIDTKDYKDEFITGFNLGVPESLHKLNCKVEDRTIYGLYTKLMVPEGYSQDSYIDFLKNSHSNYLRNISNYNNSKIQKKYPIDTLKWEYFTQVRKNPYGSDVYLMESLKENKKDVPSDIKLNTELNTGELQGQILLCDMTIMPKEVVVKRTITYVVLLKHPKRKNEIVVINYRDGMSETAKQDLNLIITYINQIKFID